MSMWSVIKINTLFKLLVNEIKLFTKVETYSNSLYCLHDATVIVIACCILF